MARAMPVISMSSPRKTNKGPEQDEVAHALVHAPDHHDVGGRGGQRDVAEGGEPKREGDRTAAKTMSPTSPTKKIKRLRLPSGFRAGPSRIHAARDGRDQRERARHVRRSLTLANRSRSTAAT